LNTPVAATVMPNSDVLITDQVNERVIQVAPKTHAIRWQYGTTGVAGSGPNQLSNPNSAELLENGHVLIADENNNRVIEVDPSNNSIKWQYPATPDPKLLNGAAFASRLPDGHTLITDSNNNRIIEIDKSSNVVWTYVTNARSGSIANPLPTRAVRLRDTEDTLISDQFNHQVIRVRKDGTIVWSLGTIGVSGKGMGLLNGPYDAKIIGQYVGLTPPPGFP
jgi:outer membrane protein assembly factor BamB